MKFHYWASTMGVEYYIINRANKTFFDLGKGGWWDLGEDKDYLIDPEYLEEYIFDNVFNGYEDCYRTSPCTREYCKSLAKELYKFCEGTCMENILFASDTTDDSLVLRALRYRCVGTRYDDNNYQSKEDRIETENRHFRESTPPHFYDAEKLRADERMTHLFDKYEWVTVLTYRPGSWVS